MVTRGVLKVAETDSTDDILENVSRTIPLECKDIQIDTDTYDTHIDLVSSAIHYFLLWSETLSLVLDCRTKKQNYSTSISSRNSFSLFENNS